MEINDIQKWLIAERITERRDLTPLINRLKNISHNEKIKTGIKTIIKTNANNYNVTPYQVAILDFEGSPVIFLGVMIYDTLFTYYIESRDYLDIFHLFVLEVLYQVQELTFFSFSEYEQQEIISISNILIEKGYNLKKYQYLESLMVVNLQKEKFESLTEALLSSGDFVFTGDPLFRNIKLINKLFITKKFNEIISHNHSCLLNESVILERWVKNYNLSRR